MTQEDKELLLKDLCARLPYEVRVKSSRRRNPVILSLDVMTDFHLGCSIKPYLRPMSSMTEEEKKEFHHIASLQHNYIGDDIFYTHWCMFDWLNANYFDYRGLIPMGIALEAPDDMYRKGKQQ